jgi:small multidrug resistance pump
VDSEVDSAGGCGDARRMIDPRRAAPFRVVLAFAAAYNVALGIWAVAFPTQFFDLVGLDQPSDLSIWRCLGMVLGLYGLLYAYAAWRLASAWPIVAVGLLGKVLGPIGWVMSVSHGEWPMRTASLIFLDDLIWWIPFSLLLLDGTRVAERVRRAAPLVCAATNALALAWMGLFLRPGTEVEPSEAMRAAYIGDHPALWRTGWMLWLVAASSFIGFLGWWSARSSRPRLALLGFAVAACGLFFDASADALFIGWLPARMDVAGPAGLLSGGFANGLYSAGGVLLVWSHATMPTRLRRWALASFVAGLGMTVAVVVGNVMAIVVITIVVFVLFVPWVLVAGRWMAQNTAKQPGAS